MPADRRGLRGDAADIAVGQPQGMPELVQQHLEEVDARPAESAGVDVDLDRLPLREAELQTGQIGDHNGDVGEVRVRDAALPQRLGQNQRGRRGTTA